MGQFDDFSNPWSAQNSQWFNEEYTKWINPEFNENIQNSQSSSHKSLIESDDKGWLNVKKNNGEIISITRYCRIKYKGYNNDKSRELFTIMDWPNLNVKASVSAISKTKSRFNDVQFLSFGVIIFERSKNRLKYGNSEWIHAATDSSNPIPKGTHNIWLPDYYHDYGEPYLNLANYATVWFRIGSEDSDRYLHVGNVSLGCVSIGEGSTGGSDSDKKRWDDIYNYLIKRRKGNKFVGIIKVL